jgi:4-alpha-glucanotransferase
MKFQFYLRFHTQYGESLWISGNTEELGNDDPALALPMEYVNEEFWHATIAIKRKAIEKNTRYWYFLKNREGEIIEEWGKDRTISLSRKDLNEVQLVDTWNHPGEFENAFFSAPFKNVLLRQASPKAKGRVEKNTTHIFKVKAPLLRKHEAVCLLGGSKALKDWDTEQAVVLSKEGDWWIAGLDLNESSFPVAYKYGVFNTKEKKFISYERGNNRLLYSDASKKKITVQHDGFVHLPNNTWKGSGVAIPVFSLRSKNSFGVGEFTDIKLLVDWASKVGLKLIQILPINDTIATQSWKDSYPYAAISAFALHPIYINLGKLAGKEYADKVNALKKKQKQLNELPDVDYEEVIKFKCSMLKELYEQMGKKCFESGDYKLFFEENKHWLQPYAVFSYCRDKYKTADFGDWKTNGIYQKAEIDRLTSAKSPLFNDIGFYFFTQFHLHAQLKEAADYAHKKGIVLKGDIPIGISRNSCDAWVAPGQYNMCWQAGAPPDDFTAVGQNWGFPTYNWKKMQEDSFAWWKQRFEQMSNYFDAFRIDHILGFFRIWSIPANAVQGIMGRFVPCLPVHIVEFGENGIWFDYQRYCKPFITDEVL